MGVGERREDALVNVRQERVTGEEDMMSREGATREEVNCCLCPFV